jgi:hypothetical protein
VWLRFEITTPVWDEFFSNFILFLFIYLFFHLGGTGKPLSQEEDASQLHFELRDLSATLSCLISISPPQ